MLPNLALFVDFLTKSGTQGEKNRQDFNADPSVYLAPAGTYQLDDADRSAFMTFNLNKMALRAKEQLVAGNATDQDWVDFFDWIEQTRTFVDGWKEEPYLDPADCGRPTAKALYSVPKPQLYDALAIGKDANDLVSVRIRAEGILDQFEVEFEHESDPTLNIAAADVVAQKAADSTFRCCRIIAKAALKPQEKYFAIVRNTMLTKPQQVQPKKAVTGI